MRIAIYGIAALVGLLGGSSCLASVNLMLSSSAPDLQKLEVGTPVSFSVKLSNLPGGSGLDGLFATAVFDSALLGAPSLTMGGVIPNALDYFEATGDGLADGAYQTLSTSSADHIDSEGTFFTFEVTPSSAGSGTVSLSFVDATQFNSGNPTQPLLIGADAGPALDFTVVSPVPGDYNDNGIVDSADYNVWLSNLGAAGPPGIPGDGSGPFEGTPDGVVDLLDYDFWKSRLGASAGATSQSTTNIPEPAAVNLIACIMAVSLGARMSYLRRRK